MAVVQISKIQIRRGKKNQGTGMPQLASGEFAWAIDTQELYIGSGAVSEGAPAVSNVKILTEKDSLLTIAAQYQYKYDAQLQYSPVNGTVLRTLQSRLDDGVVNARSFGILPSSELSPEELDQSEKIQGAINSVASTTKVALEFDPGEYQFSETISLPANANIQGFGKGLTIFKFTGTGSAFETVDMTEGQKLFGFSISTDNSDTDGIKLNRNKNLNFRSLSLTSESTDNTVGMRLIGNGAVISNNKFYEIDYKDMEYGVLGDNASNSASFNTFEDCLFYSLRKGILLNGAANYNNVLNCTFDLISEESILIDQGFGNVSRGNKFKGSAFSLTNIRFNSNGNSSRDDIFLSQSTQEGDRFTTSQVALEGSGLLEVNNTRKLTLLNGTNQFAFKIALSDATSIKVNYIFTNGSNQVRKGTLDLAVNKLGNTVSLTDEYDYVGPFEKESSLIFFASVDVSTNAVVLTYDNNNTGVSTLTYTYTILT